MMKLSKDEILNRAIGLVLGTAVGDAKGIAYETLTRQQIKELQIERRNNTEHSPQIYERVTGTNPYIPHDWLPGRWTDDTQLTLAIIRALIKTIEGGSLMDHVVTEHIYEWQQSIDGWGNSKLAIERLAKGTHTYHDSGNVAEGNGVLMKLAPLAFYYFICGTINEEDIDQICRMTHTSSVARATACTFVYLCVHLFQHATGILDFLQYALQIARKYEDKYALLEEKHLLSKRIQRYIDASLTGTLDEEVLIDVSNGGTFYCVDSLSMFIGLIALSPNGRADFETIIRATEIGGDTDSNAAMIGAIVGGTQGVSVIDKQHITSLYRSDYVQDIALQFGMALAKRFSNL